MRWTSAILLAGLLIWPVSAQAEDSLDEILARRQAELASLQEEINRATGPEFAVNRQLQFTLGTQVLQTWASRISTPYFTITAEGTRAEGDLIYSPGNYKVWIDNPTDARAFVRLSPLQLQATTSTIEARSRLEAHAEVRVFVHAYGIKTNVFCDTVPNLQAPLRASFAIQPPVGVRIPYVMRMIEPATLKGTVVCHLGNLGDYPIRFPIDDLARELARGQFDLGYSDSFRFEIPGDPPQTLQVQLSAQNQSFSIDAQSIDLGTDVAIQTPAVAE